MKNYNIFIAGVLVGVILTMIVGGIAILLNPDINIIN